MGNLEGQGALPNDALEQEQRAQQHCGQTGKSVRKEHKERAAGSRGCEQARGARRTSAPLLGGVRAPWPPKGTAPPRKGNRAIAYKVRSTTGSEKRREASAVAANVTPWHCHFLPWQQQRGRARVAQSHGHGVPMRIVVAAQAARHRTAVSDVGELTTSRSLSCASHRIPPPKPRATGS